MGGKSIVKRKSRLQDELLWGQDRFGMRIFRGKKTEKEVKMMKKLWSAAIAIMVTTFLYSGLAAAHCEIPCGIYDDEMRLEMISEHITTVEKSIHQIKDLANDKDKDYNQLIRWTNNKEQHATKIQHIVSQYFLTQRIKLEDKQYDKKLAALHRMLVYAMKCKQGLAEDNVKKLRNATMDFKKLYLNLE